MRRAFARVSRSRTSRPSTKIRGKYLEALEEDDFEVLPGSTCVVGFLRTYASYLKLDADELVEAYKTGYAPRVEEPPVVRTDVTKAPRSRTSAERRQKRVRRQHGGYVVAAVIAIIIVALLAWFGTGRGQEAASIDANSITSSTLTTTATLLAGSPDEEGTTGTDASTTTETTEGEVTGGEETAAPTDGPVALVVSVTEGSCWLVVREDGESGAEVFAGTLSAGGKQTFDTAKQYWMRVGNPEVLSVSVAGTPYTLAAPAGAFVVTGAGIERTE